MKLTIRTAFGIFFILSINVFTALRESVHAQVSETVQTAVIAESYGYLNLSSRGGGDRVAVEWMGTALRRCSRLQ
jgi:hypothetical protein